MTVDVLYVTYAKDAEWFRWSLRVLRKNLTGYRNIYVVCPKQDGELIYSIAFPGENTWLRAIEDWPGQGYYWQQWVKMNADAYSDADYIMHADSDAFLNGSVDVQDFFVDGKPSWLWSYYSDFKEPVPWQQPTQQFTGLTCEREMMQGFPFILHRSTYQQVRNWRGSYPVKQGTEDYIRTVARDGGKFSEFNVMGRIAWEKQHDLYHWVDRNRDPWPKGFHHSRQFWSHAPLEAHLPEIKNMLEGTADPAIRTTDRGIWIMARDPNISSDVEKYHRLDYDGHLLPRILPYITPGDVVVDVGAFIGDHTEAYAKAVLGIDKEGSPINTGRVMAFEPNPKPFEALRLNMAGHGHVECINKGLSNFPGTMSVSQSPNAGASHLVPGTDVQITTLDSYALTRCDLIKIDAEGLEMHILQGAWQTITGLRPVLVLEINAGALARNGVMPEDIYAWLRLRGYEITGHENSPQFDIICLPK